MKLVSSHADAFWFISLICDECGHNHSQQTTVTVPENQNVVGTEADQSMKELLLSDIKADGRTNAGGKSAKEQR